MSANVKLTVQIWATVKYKEMKMIQIQTHSTQTTWCAKMWKKIEQNKNEKRIAKRRKKDGQIIMQRTIHL